MKSYIKLVIAADGARAETISKLPTRAAIDAARRCEFVILSGEAVTDAKWKRLVAQRDKRIADYEKRSKR